MSPYLTAQGRWVFAAGAIFILLGAIVELPILIVFGQIPFTVLFVALVRLLPAARCVDRRASRFSVASGQGEQEVMTLRRGRAEELEVWFDNGSKAGLRIVDLTPFVGGDLEVDVIEKEVRVPGERAVGFDLVVTPTGIGRASLQGFDVVLNDPWGLLATRDYLPCVQVFATFPAMRSVSRRQRRAERSSTAQAIRVVDQRTRSGTDLRELRDFQPGDPLRSIAWKATVRQRRLITREYDDEKSRTEYVALDISSSMRAGMPRGAKFEHAIDLAATLTATFLDEGRTAGLWTFDEDIYGEVDARRGQAQRRRIQRHLVGLKTVVGKGRTLLKGDDLEAALADYLLVQERLDFRRGRGLRGEVDSRLLRRWLLSALREEEDRWGGRNEAYGVVDEPPSLVRRFFRLRGVPLDPPAEVDAAAKLSGLQAVIKALVRRELAGGRLTIISDLCGLHSVEILERLLALGRRRGVKVRVLAPFTPHYASADDVDRSDEAGLVLDLFTRAERRERLAVAEQLESLGVPVWFVGPNTNLRIT